MTIFLEINTKSTKTTKIEKLNTNIKIQLQDDPAYYFVFIYYCKSILCCCDDSKYCHL